MTIQKESRKVKLVSPYRSLRDNVAVWLNYSLHILIVTLTFSFSGFFLYQGYVTDSFPVANVVGILIALGMGGWVLHGMLSINRLTRKKGLSSETNRQLIDAQLREDYRDYHFHLRETQLLCIRLCTADKPGKEIRVYFDDEDVLVNIKTFLRYGDIESPYHVLANRQETREMLKRFKARAQSTPQR